MCIAVCIAAAGCHRRAEKSSDEHAATHADPQVTSAAASTPVPAVAPGPADTNSTADPAIRDTAAVRDTAASGLSLLAGLGCSPCHGVDGSGSRAPSIRGASADLLDTQLRSPASDHSGGRRPNVTDAQLARIAAFLGGDAPPATAPPAATTPATAPPATAPTIAKTASGPPADHTVPKGPDATRHHAGLFEPEKNCTPCHGPDLNGTTSVPACWSCHGSIWDSPPDVPPTHTLPEDGIAHAPGLDDPSTSCAPCHGADLAGTPQIPGCYACHGPKWKSPPAN